ETNDQHAAGTEHAIADAIGQRAAKGSKQAERDRDGRQAKTGGKRTLAKDTLERERHQEEQPEQDDVGEQAHQISASEGPFPEKPERNERIRRASLPDDEAGQQD